MAIVGSSEVSSAQWSTRVELERLFGAAQVASWADLESTNNATTIANNIAAAIEVGTDYCMNRLRESFVGVPAVPSVSLRRCATIMAALTLYAGRGINDTSDESGRHRLSVLQKEADTYLDGCVAGRHRLASGHCVNLIAVVKDESSCEDAEACGCKSDGFSLTCES